MRIYKVFRAAEWAELDRRGETEGSATDRDDGFIHFSTQEQVGGTLAKHFKGEEDLVLAACEAEALGDDLKWENEYPHLYRTLQKNEIVWTQELPRGGTDRLAL